MGSKLQAGSRELREAEKKTKGEKVKGRGVGGATGGWDNGRSYWKVAVSNRRPNLCAELLVYIVKFKDVL